MRDTRGEALGRVVDWAARQEPFRPYPGTDGRMTEDELIAAHGGSPTCVMCSDEERAGPCFGPGRCFAGVES